MSSCCAAKIILDRPAGCFYTNLDTISGKVILKVVSEISLENIQIKLKGTAYTKITKRIHRGNGINGNNSRNVTKKEQHELVYDCDTVFPPDNIRAVAKNNQGFTLTPGVYEYPFSFNFPMNSYCGDPNSIKNFSKYFNADNEVRGSQPADRLNRYDNLRSDHSGFHQNESRFDSFLKLFDHTVNHTICPLPPSTNGSIGHFTTASSNTYDIEYQLKLTVRTSSSFQTSLRNIIPLNFTTFEPSDYVISNYISSSIEVENKSRLFRFMKEPEFIDRPPEAEEKKPNFFKRIFASDGIESRQTPISFNILIKFEDKIIRPDIVPAIKISLLTKHDPSNFINTSGTSNGLGAFYLKNFQITLNKYSTFRAKDFMEDELKDKFELKNTQPNKRLDLADAKPSTNPNTPDYFELDFPSSLMSNFKFPLATRIPPTFQSCNISVTYALKIKIEIGKKSDSWRGTEKLEFRTNVWVLSGIPRPIQNMNTMSAVIDNTSFPAYDDVNDPPSYS